MTAMEQTREADAPMPDAYACQRCGRRDALDAVAPNDVWEKIREAAGVNILCLWCMDKIATELGIECSVTLHFAGRALNGTSSSDADQDFINRLVRQRDEADAECVVLRMELERLRAWCETERGYLKNGSDEQYGISRVENIIEHVLETTPSPRAAAVARVLTAAREVSTLSVLPYAESGLTNDEADALQDCLRDAIDGLGDM